MSMRPDSDPVHILLVEDNAGDVLLVEEALRETGLPFQLRTLRSGDQVIAYLNETDEGDTRRPNLILLDLNLPGKSGLEVLHAIKNDPALRRIPVLVLTTSTAPSDVSSAYDGFANCFVRKPMDFESYARMMKTLAEFWFTVAELPPT